LADCDATSFSGAGNGFRGRRSATFIVIHLVDDSSIQNAAQRITNDNRVGVLQIFSGQYTLCATQILVFQNYGPHNAWKQSTGDWWGPPKTIDLDKNIRSSSFRQFTSFVKKQHVERALLFCRAPSRVIFFSDRPLMKQEFVLRALRGKSMLVRKQDINFVALQRL
jgi:hypothetical protein